MEAVAMFSADGEKVDFNTQVTLEGPVEVSTECPALYLMYMLHMIMNMTYNLCNIYIAYWKPWIKQADLLQVRPCGLYKVEHITKLLLAIHYEYLRYFNSSFQFQVGTQYII